MLDFDAGSYERLQHDDTRRVQTWAEARSEFCLERYQWMSRQDHNRFQNPLDKVFLMIDDLIAEGACSSYRRAPEPVIERKHNTVPAKKFVFRRSKEYPDAMEETYDEESPQT